MYQELFRVGTNETVHNIRVSVEWGSTVRQTETAIFGDSMHSLCVYRGDQSNDREGFLLGIRQMLQISSSLKSDQISTSC